jgi:2-polyprenyl-6-methoxyphenol hydroxylase-like FAD-dependent oxidoreductase
MSRRVLVTGASVAGNTAAWWLAHRGFSVEVVEKAPAFRDGGQNVDVRGSARDVLRAMGLEEAAIARSTRERGIDFVDEHDRMVARFPSGEGGNRGLSAELEILRGDIARLIHAPASGVAAYRFGDTVAAIEQTASAAHVTFASGRRASYDLVIVAEGVGSSTRETLFPGENKPRWMDLTLGYFSMPATAADGAFARQYNTVGGRGATLKPRQDGRLGAYIGIQKKPEGEHEWSPERQKAFLRSRFAGDGWQIPRMLEAMSEAEDFYFDVLRQVRMGRWSTGRVVLTGDAAWCPTPLTGIGTTLAIVGGYVLAGELAATEDHAAAFSAYERLMRPFVESGQNVPKIVPRLLWPHTRPGLALLRGALRLAGKPRLRGALSRAFAGGENRLALPDYPMLTATRLRDAAAS